MGIFKKFRLLAHTAAAMTIMAAAPVSAQEETVENSQEPLVLEPSSSWKTGFTGDSCVLMREFGSDATFVSLRFTQEMPGQGFGAQLIGLPLTLASEPDNFTYQWAPDEYSRVSRSARSGVTDAGVPVLLFGGSFSVAEPPDDEDKSAKKGTTRPRIVRKYTPPERPPIFGSPRETDISALKLSGALARPLELRFGSMKSAIEALDTCQGKLLQSWGLDAEALRGIEKRASPKNHMGLWVGYNDFPRSVLEKGLSQDAVVNFRLTISPSGRVEDCRVTKPSEEEELNLLTCALVTERARFTPALDASGNPTIDFYSTAVRWSMPK